MDITEQVINVKNYVTASKLPASDYVINPYIGCPHACKYCYARFMKRFSKHSEEWGEFIDIKECDNRINLSKLKGKSLFLSSVTDCYNKYEEKYEVTKKILEQLKHAECEITISTKSKLILRDKNLLKEFPNLNVALSINTLDEQFRADMDQGSRIEERLQTLKELHAAGIHTILFMSPIFPYITEWKELIRISSDYVDVYWFENLNLRGMYKKTILTYINQTYPDLKEVYESIYVHKDNTYWETLENEIRRYCDDVGVNYCNYFYHEKLVQKKVSNTLSNPNAMF